MVFQMILLTKNSVQTITDSFSVTFTDRCGPVKQGAKFLKTEDELYLY